MIIYCIQWRRRHANRVVFREITLEGFMDQSLGDQSWCHAISGIGRHSGLAGYVAQIASISCANVFLAALSWKNQFFFCAISTIKKSLTRDCTHFTNLWLLLVLFQWPLCVIQGWYFKEKINALGVKGFTLIGFALQARHVRSLQSTLADIWLKWY